MCTPLSQVLEPAGALAVAGARAYLQRHSIKVRTAMSGSTSVKMRGSMRRDSHPCRQLLQMPRSSGAQENAPRCLHRLLFAHAPRLRTLAGCLRAESFHGQGSTVVAVTSGANMNFDRLRLVSELAQVGAQREAMLATTIPEVWRTNTRFLRRIEQCPCTSVTAAMFLPDSTFVIGMLSAVTQTKGGWTHPAQSSTRQHHPSRRGRTGWQCQ